MAFYADFWVAAAAAAPVIALANQVTVSTSLGRTTGMLHSERARLPPDQREEAKGRAIWGLAAYAISATNLIGQALMLGSSLNSLWSRTNWMSPHLVVQIEGLGIIILIPIAVFTSLMERGAKG